MAYTAPSFKQLPLSWGHLREDSNHHAMTGALGWFFQTQDATATPVTSPATVNTTTTLVVPQNAVQLFVSSATTFNITEDSSYTAKFAVPANTIFSFDCMGLTNVYLSTGSSQSVSFAFKMLQAG